MLLKLLFYSDSNQDKQDQNLLCYHYTIEQYKQRNMLLKLLFYSDSNQDKQDQNLLCYHYTIEQYFVSNSLVRRCKGNYFFINCKFSPYFFRSTNKKGNCLL